jgi:hypothetical protein
MHGISAVCSDALAEIRQLRLKVAELIAFRYIYPVTPTPVWPELLATVQKQRAAGMVWPTACDTMADLDLPPTPVAGSGLRIASRPNGSFVAEPSDGDGVALKSMAHPGWPSTRPETAEPAPEPWGSPFAMNTENWK